MRLNELLVRSGRPQQQSTETDGFIWTGMNGRSRTPIRSCPTHAILQKCGDTSSISEVYIERGDRPIETTCGACSGNQDSGLDKLRTTEMANYDKRDRALNYAVSPGLHKADSTSLSHF